MKVESYRMHVLLNADSKKYHGELWVNNKREIRTHPLMNELVTISALNKRIDSFNFLNSTKIPHYEKGNMNMKKFEPKPVKAESPKIELTGTTPKPATLQKPPRKPHRKPFTPYGLTGYLVDKHGNIRLHLDRRASARTIVLEPAMFAMLAEMVKATQEQQNEPNI